MRRLPFLVCALMLLVAAAPARASGPQTGGSPAPSGGGVTYNAPLQKVRAWDPASFRPVAREFSVSPSPLVLGSTATFTYRIDSREDKRVHARIILRRGGAKPVRLRLGSVRTGVRHAYKWTPAADAVAAGRYSVALRAIDPHMRALRRTAHASGRQRLVIQPAPPPPPAPFRPRPRRRSPGPGSSRSSVPFSFGGDDARFGAGRDGHIHQGQDVIAAEGTPLVAPRRRASSSGSRTRRAAPATTSSMRAADGRDYVFMHLEAGSMRSPRATGSPGPAVRQVGATGDSTGPHLHFEIWPDGWYSSKASAPIDPLPQLRRGPLPLG